MADVYESDPDAAPDRDFEPGELRHLVPGNRGRLLDARRTPVVVAGLDVDTGQFDLEVQAFEDIGALWRLPLEDVSDFQFARDGKEAGGPLVDALRAAVERLDYLVEVPADPATRVKTLARIAEERRQLAADDTLREAAAAVDVAAAIAVREGSPRLFDVLEARLAERGLTELDRRFTTTLVSNPRSGEVVKGHAIVLAELGLCPFVGKAVRDPRLFAGEGANDRRAEHLIFRIAFSQGLWSALGHLTVLLHRAAATDGPLPAPRPSSFVSATFSSDVADAHFAGGPHTRVAVRWRQSVPLERLVMTFLETRSMSERFKEAEALLVAEPDSRAF